MKVSSECIPCVLRQVIRTARIASEGDEWLERKILNEIMAELSTSGHDIPPTPAELTFLCHQKASRILGMQDAYLEERKEMVQQTLALESKMRELVEKEDQPILAAALLATALCTFEDLLDKSRNLEIILQRGLMEGFVHSDFEEFLKDLETAKTILYLLGSSGELVGDKIFLEHIEENREITLVVRKEPIIADATLEDVELAGLDHYSIIHPGHEMRGITLEQTSKDFRQKFEEADLVIAKGQAHYETLSASERVAYYMIRPKCDYMAGQLGVKVYDLVFLKE